MASFKGPVILATFISNVPVVTVDAPEPKTLASPVPFNIIDPLVLLIGDEEFHSNSPLPVIGKMLVLAVLIQRVPALSKVAFPSPFTAPLTYKRPPP